MYTAMSLLQLVVFAMHLLGWNIKDINEQTSLNAPIGKIPEQGLLWSLALVDVANPTGGAIGRGRAGSCSLALA